ncbi:AAA family ATPase [Microbacterium esteraromaticum]|uniref:AAA family ATPase n=1 Tax=Microbacterium esteraromaticum TaxID=57043 RepID=UPI0021BD491A|nr:AAA family ATPase [Microbacterium esteraromaticum]
MSAPSGYGKTTAVVEWSTGADRLAWLTLNTLDSEPSRLARGVLDALAIASDGRTGALPHTARFDPRRAYAAIIDGLESADGVVHLVVDEAHRAGEAWRDGLLGMLLEQVPEKLRIVLVGTTLLEVTSARERLSAPEMFLSADLLRFTADEITNCTRRDRVRSRPPRSWQRPKGGRSLYRW